MGAMKQKMEWERPEYVIGAVVIGLWNAMACFNLKLRPRLLSSGYESRQTFGNVGTSVVSNESCSSKQTSNLKKTAAEVEVN